MLTLDLDGDAYTGICTFGIDDDGYAAGYIRLQTCVAMIEIRDSFKTLVVKDRGSLVAVFTDVSIQGKQLRYEDEIYTTVYNWSGNYDPGSQTS